MLTGADLTAVLAAIGALREQIDRRFDRLEARIAMGSQPAVAGDMALLAAIAQSVTGPFTVRALLRVAAGAPELADALRDLLLIENGEPGAALVVGNWLDRQSRVTAGELGIRRTGRARDGVVWAVVHRV